MSIKPDPDPVQNLDPDPVPDPDPGGGRGGRSAKNVHPPWQNPRYAPVQYYYKIWKKLKCSKNRDAYRMSTDKFFKKEHQAKIVKKFLYFY